VNSNATTPLTELPVETLDGQFTARYSLRGLTALEFPRGGGIHRHKNTSATAVPRRILNWHRIVTRALARALAGQPPGKLPPLDLLSGTDFQRCVWNELRKISTGESRTYGELAHAIGKPKAVRAVGGACGANPIPVFLPCHRVLAANGKLGGFSSGLEWKKKMLKREGIGVCDGDFAG
jgi:AraC family transcriptional regulator of adaptative response/methylated-DNA-[protein]-cysteine methyltransferase